MRYDKDGIHTLDEDLRNLFKEHGWTLIEITIPGNPNWKTDRIARWNLRAKVMK